MGYKSDKDYGIFGGLRMKKIIVTILILTLSFSLFASKTNDFAIMVGGGNFFNPKEGASFSYGITLGLTKRVDTSLVVMSELTPNLFDRNIILLELSMTLFGPRNTSSKVAGICVNSILSFGSFYRFDNKGIGAYIGVTPLSIGSPITSKRERGLRTNIGYDFVNKKLFVTFSPLDIEIYLVGTYRDWI